MFNIPPVAVVGPAKSNAPNWREEAPFAMNVENNQIVPTYRAIETPMFGCVLIEYYKKENLRKIMTEMTSHQEQIAEKVCIIFK
jgi:uncharacterized protein with WD repeat